MLASLLFNVGGFGIIVAGGGLFAWLKKLSDDSIDAAGPIDNSTEEGSFLRRQRDEIKMRRHNVVSGIVLLFIIFAIYALWLVTQ